MTVLPRCLIFLFFLFKCTLKPTPLHLACMRGHEAVVKVLITQGKADINRYHAWDRCRVGVVYHNVTKIKF